MPQQRKAGMAVDPSGGPVVDPTANVIALNEASTKRLDDLRDAEGRRVTESLTFLQELGNLRATHAREMRDLETRRLDAVRQVDVAAANTERERTVSSINALAAQTRLDAENHRTALDRAVSTISERVAALEKSSYMGAGKETFSDPMMAQLMSKMNALLSNQAAGIGKTEGGEASRATTRANISMMIGALALLGSLIFNLLKR